MDTPKAAPVVLCAVRGPSAALFELPGPSGNRAEGAVGRRVAPVAAGFTAVVATKQGALVATTGAVTGPASAVSVVSVVSVVSAATAVVLVAYLLIGSCLQRTSHSRFPLDGHCCKTGTPPA